MPDPAEDVAAADEKTFQDVVQPLLKKYCVQCHNPEKMKSGVRVDLLTGTLEDRHLALWKNILKQVENEDMPPEDEPRLADGQRRLCSHVVPQTAGQARGPPMRRKTDRYAA